MNFAELFKYLIPIKFIRLNIISEVIGRFPQIITIAIQQHIKWLTDIPSQCFKIEIPNIYYLKYLFGGNSKMNFNSTQILLRKHMKFLPQTA